MIQQINHLNKKLGLGRYDNSNRFKTSMIRSSLCDYGDAYFLKEL